jgi:hypothetical protein
MVYASLPVIDEDMDTLRGIEIEAASVYFSIYDDMIFQQKDDFYNKTRNKRPPLDNVNALLSFTYSLTTVIYTSALESVGGVILMLAFNHIFWPYQSPSTRRVWIGLKNESK